MSAHAEIVITCDVCRSREGHRVPDGPPDRNALPAQAAAAREALAHHGWRHLFLPQNETPEEGRAFDICRPCAADIAKAADGRDERDTLHGIPPNPLVAYLLA